MDGSKSVVLLNKAVADYNGNTLPIFQLLSEKHDTNTLSYWIREWLRSGVHKPKQIVTYDSAALWNVFGIQPEEFNGISLSMFHASHVISITDKKKVIKTDWYCIPYQSCIKMAVFFEEIFQCKRFLLQF